MGLYSEDPEENLRVCAQLVEEALKQVHAADMAYIKAMRDHSEAKVAVARNKRHEWYGMTVYRIMGGEGLRNRLEHGIVCFKEFEDPDYGNPHISPGSYYVLVGKKTAHALSKEWELDLL